MRVRNSAEDVSSARLRSRRPRPASRPRAPVRVRGTRGRGSRTVRRFRTERQGFALPRAFARALLKQI